MSESAEQLLREKRKGKWYAKGVHFRCVAPECNDCCTGSRGEGYVWVTADDMEKMAQIMDMEFDKFTRTYIRQINWSFSLIEKPNKDCIFLDGQGCKVYEARPGQCRTYPFWPEVVNKKKTWRKEAAQCPGINDDAPLVPALEIDRQLALDAESRAAYDESEE